jgi:hypothetical protein
MPSKKSKLYPPVKRAFVDRVTIHRRPRSRFVTIELEVGAKFMDELNRASDVRGDLPQWLIIRALALELNGGICHV